MDDEELGADDRPLTAEAVSPDGWLLLKPESASELAETNGMSPTPAGLRTPPV
jgi:hypothetical protein